MRRIALTAALLLATPAVAQSDPRLRVRAYVADSVVTVRVVPGYVAAIVLGDDERVESVASGNSGAWDVTPSKSGDHLFVKPLATGVTTNVEVVTDSRHYSFLLQTTFEGDPEATFQLRFAYPAAVAPVPAVTAPVIATALPAGDYRISGDRLARPLGVRDDGVRTTFVFGDAAALPAIYAIDDQGHEALVTARRVPDGWEVDRIWRRYVLRLGRAQAQAVRRKGAAR
jgi:type IV secretion system protein VirB9